MSTISLISKLLTAGTFLVVVGSANAEVDLVDHKWSEHCNNENSFAAQYQNNTYDEVDIRICLERVDGEWSCFTSTFVDPGEVVPSGWGYFVCEGTGGSFVSWRDAGDYSTDLSDPPGSVR